MDNYPSRSGHRPMAHDGGYYDTSGRGQHNIPVTPYQPIQPVAGPQSSFNAENVYIAVMGVTGAGKSSFISHCTGQRVKIGNTLEACTTEVDEYTFQYEDTVVHLIDTPGFDDTYRSDREVLEGIATWMGTAYEQHIKLSAVMYLHRITDNRMGGVALRNLVMFKKLCGEAFYPRVFLVTTMWDKVSLSEAKTREGELTTKSDFWGTMLQGGSNVERHWGDRESAMKILSKAIRNRRIEAPPILKVQREMIDQNLQLADTAAGQLFQAELIRQREQYEKEMKQMQSDIKELLEMNQIRAAEETEKQRRLFEEKIAKGYDDQEKLRTTLHEMQQRQAQDLARMQQQFLQDRQLYEEKIQRLERRQTDLSQHDNRDEDAESVEGEIVRSRAEINQLERKLDDEGESIKKAVQRLLVKGKEWAQQNPEIIAMIASQGMRFVPKALQRPSQKQAKTDNVRDWLAASDFSYAPDHSTQSGSKRNEERNRRD